jgi:hypothetical protein
MTLLKLLKSLSEKKGITEPIFKLSTNECSNMFIKKKCHTRSMALN